MYVEVRGNVYNNAIGKTETKKVHVLNQQNDKNGRVSWVESRQVETEVGERLKCVKREETKAEL